MIKKLLALFVTSITLGLVGAVASSGSARHSASPEDPSAEPTSYRIDQTPGDLHGQGKIDEYPMTLSDCYGIQFKNGAAFEGVEILIGNRGGGSVTLTLYPFRNNYAETVKGDPVAKCSVRPTTDYAWVSLTGNFEAGEYLLIADNGRMSQTVVVPQVKSDRAIGYYNHSRATYIPACHIIGEASLETPTEPAPQSFASDASSTWVATDGLGRVVPLADTTGGFREGKTVGIFFHTWHSTKMHASKTVGDVTDILEKYPDIGISDYNDPRWGDYPVYFWDEPIWGYYRSDDEWVLRNQAELLADAGIDVVFFDCTNYTEVWMEEALTLLEVWAKARLDGVRTPQVAFQLNMFDYEHSAIQLRRLYNELYGKGLYEDLWFYWKGKPLVIGFPEQLDKNASPDKEIREFFTYRCINTGHSQDGVVVRNPETGAPIIRADNRRFTDLGYQLWNWISSYPQVVNRNPDNTPEQVAVSVAINWSKETHLTAMSNQKYDIFSRDYIASEDRYDTRENAACYGAYFEDQWKYALNVDPEFIFITGWNEWTAGRYESYHADFNGEVTNAFIDNFIPNRSRDIEPSTGILKDHYYYQMVSFIRQYKGSAAAPSSSGAVKVNSTSEIAWDAVAPVYQSYEGNTLDRSHLGYNNTLYTNRTGRNDIVESRVTYDAHNLYFMVKTAEALTPYTDPAWMQLFIDVEGVDDGRNWESFEYVINRTSPTAKSALLERSLGGWSWEEVCPVKYTADGNVLVIAVPRAAIGVDTGNEVFTVNFKWMDNVRSEGDIMAVYTDGDAAPGGRFKYQFVSRQEAFTAEELETTLTEPTETEERQETEETLETKEQSVTKPPVPVTKEKGKGKAYALLALAGATVAAAVAIGTVSKRKKQ